MSDFEDEFWLVKDDGSEVKGSPLFTFDLEETGKSYIIYAVGEEDEDGEIEVCASTFEEQSDGNIKLYDVETQGEWNLIESITNKLSELIASGIEDMDELMDELHEYIDNL